jgi:hypothetical protein
MHSGALVVLVALAFAGCSSSGSGSGTGLSSSSSNTAACNGPSGFPEAGPGVVACTVGRAYLKCATSGGGGCLCISDDPSQCPGCGPSKGFSCTNQCLPGWYGVSCGGPPNPAGGYQSLPSGCTSLGYTPGGSEFGCCPCGMH